MGIPVFRSGYWHYGNAPDIEGRLIEVQREMMGLASIGRAYNVAMAVHNMTGDNVIAIPFHTFTDNSTNDPAVFNPQSPAHLTYPVLAVPIAIP